MYRMSTLSASDPPDTSPPSRLLHCSAYLVWSRLARDVHLASGGFEQDAVVLHCMPWLLDHSLALKAAHRHTGWEHTSAPRAQAALDVRAQQTEPLPQEASVI